MIWHDVEQTGDEWFDLKLGKPGGSKAATYMANASKAKTYWGKPAREYAITLALETINRTRGTEFPPTLPMQRGTEQEPIARSLYESTTLNVVTNGGWFDCETHGTSPDGLVDLDGCIEIKCTGRTAHWAVLKSKKYSSEYKWQLINHLEVTGRDWVDFVNYCSDFPEYAQLFIQRVYAKNVMAEIAALRVRRAKFVAKIAEEIALIEKKRD